MLFGLPGFRPGSGRHGLERFRIPRNPGFGIIAPPGAVFCLRGSRASAGSGAAVPTPAMFHVGGCAARRDFRATISCAGCIGPSACRCSTAGRSARRRAASCECALPPTKDGWREAIVRHPALRRHFGEVVYGRNKRPTWGVVVRTAGGPEALEWTPLTTARAGARRSAHRPARPSASTSSTPTFRSGLYPWPSTAADFPAAEAAGVVAEIGEAVADFKRGRIASRTPCRWGAYRTQRVVPAERLVKLPDAIAFDVAASVMLKGLTAQFLLMSCYPVKAGRYRSGARGRRRGWAAARAVVEGTGAPPRSARRVRRRRWRWPRPMAIPT